MTSQRTQPARKILIIGGSTYNTNTPQKIRQAFIESKFLDEWAVIITIHQYLRLKDKNHPLNKFIAERKSDFSLPGTFEPQISLITFPKIAKVETGHIYILPDPGLPIDRQYLYTTFMGDSYQLKICTETSVKAQKEFEKCLFNNPFDASNTKRQMTPQDILSEEWEKLPIRYESEQDKFKAKSKASALTPKERNEVVYRDMPYIDKFMSEVAASESKPKIAALLLCGLHGDGANGLKKIKNNGGHTAVQLPDECCHNQLGHSTSSMPKTALDIEPSHKIVTLEDKPDYMKLSDWLTRIK
ncbi:chemotaxis protein CheB [Nodularia spumigena CS-591/04]|jgi:hypothetical protein|uniref:chemotaxis protein CheB n=1 Tax=Nodularia spumigena TaxID=70799 RepID=UPI00232B4DCE|nr:chemotaxis protein CheB [Nodularia spumigena]MDB9322356.1 chemotaxis protein CheB [Nodularia spumigena CS-591/07A]MDB9330916.1 chemotaxis protein CheB [Nodularia spumigena CS-591/04]MDB9360221.1 chemotaxis protein CheB [Nodularia spumigena CS-588/02]MDB9366163.1 chemotaxis protein CheB [Nodularia spumigena CS-588/02A10]